MAPVGKPLLASIGGSGSGGIGVSGSVVTFPYRKLFAHILFPLQGKMVRFEYSVFGVKSEMVFIGVAQENDLAIVPPVDVTL
jgi:hypothetical protein